MGKWLNNDGLYIKTGVDEAVRTLGGMYPFPTKGGTTVVEAEVLFSSAITTTPGIYIASDVTIIPANAQIEFVDVIWEVAGTSAGNADLDVGLCNLRKIVSGSVNTADTLGTPPTTPEIDYNGLVAALDGGVQSGGNLPNFAAGKTYSLINGSTSAGALVGLTTGTAPSLICVNAVTAVMTGGRCVIRVGYRENFTVTNPSNTTSDTSSV